jgi:hypothetical protein
MRPYTLTASNPTKPALIGKDALGEDHGGTSA